MYLAEVLNNSQFTLLSMLVAVVTDLCNISVKELVPKNENLKTDIKNKRTESKRCRTLAR
jgi:hypothetical protein